MLRLSCLFVALLVAWLPCCSSPGVSPVPDVMLVDAVGVHDAPSVRDARRTLPENCNGVDDDGDGRVDEGCPIRLTFDPHNDFQATLQGGRLVWNNSGATYLRALPHGDVQTLPFYCASPSLWGHRIACASDGEYRVHDLVTGAVERVDTNGALWIGAPQLHGDILAWAQAIGDPNADNYQVYVHDLASGTTTRITSGPQAAANPRSDGSALVWDDDRYAHHYIGFCTPFDVFTTVLVPGATDHPVSMRSGSVVLGAPMGFESGRVLVTEYSDPHDCVGNLLTAQCQPVIYDVATRARTELSPLAMPCDEAGALSGNRVAVEFDPLGVSDIVLIDATTHVRRRVTDYPRRSTMPLLEGDILVWSDDRNDNWDLYMMDVSGAERGEIYPEGVVP